MGVRHTTLASASTGNEDFSKDILESDTQLSQTYEIDRYLYPGSGRMTRTFRLKHKQNGSTVVVKFLWLTQEELKEDGATTDNNNNNNPNAPLESLLRQQQQKLERIQKALQGDTHVAPFLYWFVGPYRNYNMNTVRPAILVRPHFYTTLSDRLASRPFLTHVEKLWIIYQLLQALDSMHSKDVVHGFLTTENIGLSSWNWVVLTDLSSYKARTKLPDDDPSEYLYYYQELFNQQGSDSTPREKRCYLAPERFYTPGQEQDEPPASLTPAMDIFSAGCVIMETFLNGERALDLGDLMEYRKQQSSQPLQQKLNKIEFSALRAACRHMLSLDPTQRLSAKAYLERLEASDLVPSSFFMLSNLLSDATTSSGDALSIATPDARLAKAAAYYTAIIYETMGIYDTDGKSYFEKALGATTSSRVERAVTGDDGNNAAEPETGMDAYQEEKKEQDTDSLLAETEALLKQLEALSFDDEAVHSMATKEAASVTRTAASTSKPAVERSQMAQNSLLVYLQLVLSTVRHVQRPASKLVALQLMDRISKYSTDEARLQRIVPVTVSLLQDQDPLVRAAAIQVLTSTISIVGSFPPSDSKVFPQYIFKRVAHLVTDPSLVVRLSFAKCVAILAETSHRFLDISHAVRLYEAVGGSSSAGNSSNTNPKKAEDGDVFGDDVANLLDASGDTSTSLKRQSTMDSMVSDVGEAGKTLISSTYSSDLSALHETVSRWVVHITTDLSEHSSPVKRALLADMARLCNFFGLDGVMAFILPQVLSFLNDRKDWPLRATLFEHLQEVCQFIGRAATEHFVLPILETALVDFHEVVISRALLCLSELLRMGLLSRSALLGRLGTGTTDESPGILKKYGALLLHPSSDVRSHMISTVNALCEIVGELDAEVFVVPIIRPFIRFHPSKQHLFTPDGLEKCLYPAWPREKFESELTALVVAADTSPTSGQWTSIALQVKDGGNDRGDNSSETKDKSAMKSQKESIYDEQSSSFRSYLQMVARGRNYAMKMGADDNKSSSDLDHAIEGSLKLAQQIKFPRQDLPGPSSATLPSWYSSVLENKEQVGNTVRETTAIRSVSALGQVYGLSIMDQAGVTAVSESISAEEAISLLHSDEAKNIEAACNGEWGSEACLDPALTDTSLLLTKLSALHVPPLPPRLSEERALPKPNPPQRAGARENADPRDSPVFKPKIDTVIATSRRVADAGHTAPITRLAVSHDQSFFVTGSHDGTCRVWEAEKAERSNGVLESSLTYAIPGANRDGTRPRVNDLVMVEGSHSVATGTSDGSVHVWRVDLVSSSTSSTGESSRDMRRVAGSTDLRKMNPSEGEVLAVNQFNTSGSSVMMYATQAGRVHSWDLRSAQEPFCLESNQDTGFITSLAVGNDRHWAVVGTNRGFVSLWDLRFQQQMKLWHHSRASPIDRLATSFVPPPQSWLGKGYSNIDARPYIFAASGPNECAMFDALSGHCSECFRTVEYGNNSPRIKMDEVPRLQELPLLPSARRKALFSLGIGQARLGDVLTTSFKSVKCMVGSTGASNYSFLITGGSDCRIRFWDFSMPSRCYVSTAVDPVQPRPSFERIDFDSQTRLMLCRQAPAPTVNELDSSRKPRKLFQGTRAIPQGHNEAITDLKFLKNNLVSCSRDCTVKLWR